MKNQGNEIIYTKECIKVMFFERFMREQEINIQIHEVRCLNFVVSEITQIFVVHFDDFLITFN